MATLSECHAEAPREDVNGSAVAVVSGVDDGLVHRREGDEIADVKPIVKVADDFRRVSERTVADDETVPAAGQITPVQLRKTAHDDGSADDVIGPIPRAAVLRHADGDRPVDLGERPRLVVAIVPAEPHERTERMRELLLDGEGKTVLGATVLARGRDVVAVGRRV